MASNKRSVEAELNLIPFIDLLSVCILFLLMTAVWVEISKMSAFTQAGGESTVRQSDRTSLLEEREDRDWDVLVSSQGVQVIADGEDLGHFETEGAYDLFEELKGRLTDPSDAKISLRASDEVVYAEVIIVLDALFSAELMNVSIGGIN